MGHITFKTKDGAVVMHRESMIHEWHAEDQDRILRKDADHKGVKIIEIRRDGKDFICEVEWLRH